MKKVFLLITVCLAMIFSGCESSETRITKQSFVFDTVVSITANEKDSEHINKALQLCSDFELTFSRTNPESELYKLNNSDIVTLSENMRKVLEFSLNFSEMSDGAFDVTVEPLVSLWDVKNRKAPPTSSAISEALKTVGYQNISLEPFSANNSTIDLGAIAKGYVADMMSDYFTSHNVRDVIIDLGGNVAVIGEFTVGIRNPSSPDEIFASFTLKDKSAVTSGAYQRYFEYEGKTYHHIIDPRTGYPSDSGIASVTVISPSSMQADAISTAIFISGEDAISLCNEFPDTDALIITNDQRIVTTDNFEERYKLQLIK